MHLNKLKAVILCGGYGSRLSEETVNIPKPMVKIGKKPIVCHIIDIFKKYGIEDFLLLTGYKSSIIKKYFQTGYKNLNIQTLYTGKNSQTGGRLLRAKKYLLNENFFFLTYGDGVSDVNIKKLVNFHIKNKRVGTVTMVKPTVRFGELKHSKNLVTSFKEKPQAESGWISGGFFLFNKEIFRFLKNDLTILEKSPMIALVKKKQLSGYKHNGFWQCMDTMREKKLLISLLAKGKAPWKN
jgi:glucose-1-phosphate cytidylyltransferase